MPDRTLLGAVGEFAASHHGIATRRQAAVLGLGSTAATRLVRKGVFDEPAPGVLRIVGSPHTWRQSAYIATKAAAGAGVIIGAAAGRLHELDGCESAAVHVAVVRRGRVTLEDVRVSHLLGTYDVEQDVLEIDGIRCATIARAVCDIARFQPALYERVADDFQRRRYSLTWLAQTAARIPRKQRSGLEVIETDLERRQRGGSVRGSWFEHLVEECLVSPRIPPVERQYEVRDRAGAFVARVDLAIPSLRLAIEADSRRFHTGQRVETYDEHRHNRLVAVGWQTTYVGWTAATASPGEVRAMVEEIVAERRRELRKI